MKIVRLVLLAGLAVAPAACKGTPLTAPTEKAVPAAQVLMSTDSTDSMTSTTSSDTTSTSKDSGHMIGSGN